MTQCMLQTPSQLAHTSMNRDENEWVSIGTQFGADSPADAAPSEKQWATLFKGTLAEQGPKPPFLRHGDNAQITCL